MKHLFLCAAFALSLCTMAQPVAFTTSTPLPTDITCCSDRLQWANTQNVIDSMALSEWHLLQTFNNQLNVGSPPVSRRWTNGQLDSMALSTVTRNAQLYYSMTRLWLYGTTVDPMQCSTWYLSDSSACVNGVRQYTYLKLPLNCTGTPFGPAPAVSKPCTTAPTCTSYSGVTWGSCIGGTQTGTYTKLPVGCIGTPSGSIPVTSRACTSNYSLTFLNANPLSLPGCTTVQQWQTVTITGSTAAVSAYTSIPFTSPQTGVKSIVLKNFSGTPAEYTWINDQVRIKGGKFVLASDYTKVLGTVPTTKANATITFPAGSPVTISYLLGNTAFNTAKFTLEGIDLLKCCAPLGL